MGVSVVNSNIETDPLWSAAGLKRHFTFIARISPLFRRRRIRQFLQTFQPGPDTRILDVGGLPRFWQGAPIESRITITNLDPLDDYEASFLTRNQNFVPDDATLMRWDDEEFDIVFSNSVIEHLGTAEHQAEFVRECRRVGRGYWIQTPAKEFPVEPHFLTLFLHWCSKATQKKLLRHFSVWGLLARPRPEALDAVLAELRLLSLPAFKTLLPEATILTERFLGLPKSYVAMEKHSSR